MNLSLAAWERATVLLNIVIEQELAEPMQLLGLLFKPEAIYENN